MAIISFTNYKRGQTTGCMGAVMRYTMQDKKTKCVGQRLVTGINCQPESVYADFMTTKRLHHKTDGVLFYHMVQSFPKGEAVEPVTAHAAALKLAEYYMRAMKSWSAPIQTGNTSIPTFSSTPSTSILGRNCTSQRSSFRNCDSATIKSAWSFLSLCSTPRTGKRRPRRCPSASITPQPVARAKNCSS